MRARPFDFGVTSGALTHGNPSGYLPAGVLAVIVHLITRGAALGDVIGQARLLLAGSRGADETLDALDAGVKLASRGIPSPAGLESLGGGWMGHDALSISICCPLAADGFASGVLAAVNHSGDSDSTGSITGNVLGALHGESALPPDWIRDLEAVEIISPIADDLTAVAGHRIEPNPESLAETLYNRYPPLLDRSIRAARVAGS